MGLTSDAIALVEGRKEFPVPDPASRLVEHLTVLEKAQLVRPAAGVEPAYVFKHALTQEAAYQSLLRATRAELHRRVAEALEQFFSGELDQNAAALEYHYEQAGHLKKAFEYAVRAADRAARAFAHAEALSFYDLALHLASRQEPLGDNELTARLAQLYLSKGRVLEVMGNHAAAVENYRALIELARRSGDAAVEADGLNHLVTAQVVLTGPTEETAQQLERALVLAQAVQHPELTARALWNRGLGRRLTDPLWAARDFEQALEIADRANLRELAAFVRMDLSLALVLLRRARPARDYLNQALTEFRALELKPMLADALGTLAYHAYTRGESTAARDYAEEGLTTSHLIENPWGILYNQMFSFFVFELARGHLERAFLESEAFLARARQLGYPYFAVMHHTVLALACLELNQAAQAQVWADAVAGAFGMDNDDPLSDWARWLQAAVLMERGETVRAEALLTPLRGAEAFPLGPLDFSGWLGQTLAELAWRKGDLNNGITLCDKLIAEFEEQQQSGFAAGIYYWRARLHFAGNDLPEAEQDARRASALLEQAENRILLWRAHALLAEIYRADGNRTATLDRSERARAVIEYIAGHSPSELRESFLRRDAVQRVLRAGAG